MDMTSVKKGVVSSLWSATNDFGHFAKIKTAKLLTPKIARVHEYKMPLKEFGLLEKTPGREKNVKGKITRTLLKAANPACLKS